MAEIQKKETYHSLEQIGKVVGLAYPQKSGTSELPSMSDDDKANILEKLNLNIGLTIEKERDSASNYHITEKGTRVSDTTCDLKKYLFNSGDVVRVKIKKEYDAVYQWQTDLPVPVGENNQYLIGDVVFEEADGYIVAPDTDTKKVYLVFSQKKDNTTNNICKLKEATTVFAQLRKDVDDLMDAKSLL